MAGSPALHGIRRVSSSRLSAHLTELPVRVVAEALDRAIVEQGASMLASRRNAPGKAVAEIDRGKVVAELTGEVSAR